MQMQLHLWRFLHTAPDGQMSVVIYPSRSEENFSPLFLWRNIIKEKLRRTAFTHVFRRDNVIALYNTLRIKPIYVSPWVLEAIELFSDGKTIDDVTEELPKDVRDEFREILPALCEAKILVNADSTDEEILDHFRKHHTGHPYVSIAYFILTEACNLGCMYCFVENRMDSVKREHMSPTTVREGLDFFEQLIRRKPEFFHEEKTIVIYGGEPLTNTDTLKTLLVEIRECKADGRLPEKTQISMVTNATLVTTEIANLLREHDVNVAVSIDGDAHATNSARQFKNGSPAFERIKQGYMMLKDAGVRVGISCTLNVKSIERFDDTLRTLVDELGTDSLGFNIALSSKMYPLPDTYDERASKAILRAFEQFRNRNIFEDRIMRKVEAFVDGKIYPYDCGASGGGQIVIAPDGNVGVCHGYLGDRKYFCTNVRDDTFDQSVNPVFLEWAKRSPLNMDACKTCPALGLCGGGCPLNADNETGSMWNLDARFCVHAKMTLEWLIWDLYEQMLHKATYILHPSNL